MIRPSRDEFRALARDHTVIPVWRELLADLTTPVAAFARLVGDQPGFLLESVEHGEARWSRWSFCGRNPLATLTAQHRRIGDLCKECGQATFVYEEGCKKCLSCGFNEC